MAPDRKALEEAGRRKLEEFRKAKAAKAAAGQQKGSPSPGLSPSKADPAPQAPVNPEPAQPWTNGASTVPAPEVPNPAPAWPTTSYPAPTWPGTQQQPANTVPEPANFTYSTPPAPYQPGTYNNGYDAAPPAAQPTYPWDTGAHQQQDTSALTGSAIPFTSATNTTYGAVANGVDSFPVAASSEPFAAFPSHSTQQDSTTAGLNTSQPTYGTAALFSSQPGTQQQADVPPPAAVSTAAAYPFPTSTSPPAAQPHTYQYWAPEPVPPAPEPAKAVTETAAPQTTWSVVTNASALFGGGGDDSPHAFAQPDPFAPVSGAVSSPAATQPPSYLASSAPAHSTYDWGQSGYGSSTPAPAAPAASTDALFGSASPVPYTSTPESVHVMSNTAALFPPSPESQPPPAADTTAPYAVSTAAGTAQAQADSQPASPPPPATTTAPPWLTTPTPSSPPATTPDPAVAGTFESAHVAAGLEQPAYTTVTTNALYDTSPVSTTYTQGASPHASPSPGAGADPYTSQPAPTPWHEPTPAGDGPSTALQPVPYNTSYTDAASSANAAAGVVSAAAADAPPAAPPTHSWWSSAGQGQAASQPQHAQQEAASGSYQPQDTTTAITDCTATSDFTPAGADFPTGDAASVASPTVAANAMPYAADATAGADTGAAGSIPFNDSYGTYQTAGSYDWMGSGSAGGQDATTYPMATTWTPAAVSADNTEAVQGQAAAVATDDAQGQAYQYNAQGDAVYTGQGVKADQHVSGYQYGAYGVSAQPVSGAADGSADAAGAGSAYAWMTGGAGSQQDAVQGSSDASKVSNDQLAAWAYNTGTSTASNLYGASSTTAYGTTADTSGDAYTAAHTTSYGYSTATGNAFGTTGGAASDAAFNTTSANNGYESTNYLSSFPTTSNVFATTGGGAQDGQAGYAFAADQAGSGASWQPAGSAVFGSDATSGLVQGSGYQEQPAASVAPVATKQYPGQEQPQQEAVQGQQETAGGQGADGQLSLADAFASFVQDDEGAKPLSSRSSHDQAKDSRKEGDGAKKSRFAWLFGTPKTPYSPTGSTTATAQDSVASQVSSAGGAGASAAALPPVVPSETQAPPSTDADLPSTSPAPVPVSPPAPEPTSWGSSYQPSATASTTTPTDATVGDSAPPASTHHQPVTADSVSDGGVTFVSGLDASHSSLPTTASPTTYESAQPPSSSAQPPVEAINHSSSLLNGMYGSYNRDQSQVPSWLGSIGSTATTTSSTGQQGYSWGKDSTNSQAAEPTPRPGTPVPDSTPAQPGLTHSSSFVFENPQQPPMTGQVQETATDQPSSPSHTSATTSTAPATAPETAATVTDASAAATWSTYQPGNYFSFLPASSQPPAASTLATTALPVSPTTMLSAPYTYSSYQDPAADSLIGGSSQDKSFLESYLDNLLRFDESLNAVVTTDAGPGQGTQQEDTTADGHDGPAGSSDGQHGEAGDGAEHLQQHAAGDGLVAAEDDGPLSGRASGSLSKHDKHVSDTSGSTWPHHVLANGHGGQHHSMPRVGSATQFSVLHQHIEELTQEKMELQRGLAAQVKLHAAIEEENAAMVERLNAQGKQIEGLKSKLDRYEMELNAQVLAVEGMAAEREAARAGQSEAADRATALAGEVVSLEAALRSAKSHGLKMEKEVETLQQQVDKLSRQLGGVRKESSSAAGDVERLTQEKRALFVRLKQTEARLSKLLDDTGASARTRESMLTGLSPIKAESVEQEVQCDLISDADLQQLRAELQHAQAAASQAAAELAAAHETARAAGERAEQATARTSHLEEQLRSQRATAESVASPVQQPSTPRGLISHMSSFTPPTDRDPTTAMITDKLLSSIPQATLTALSVAKDVPESLLGPVAQLGRWLPMGPISASCPEGAVVEEQLRLLTSIHAMLNQQEDAHALAMEQLEVLEIENTGLRRNNEDLRRKLEMTMQRLELSLTQGAGMEQTLSLAGLVPRHTPLVTHTTTTAAATSPHLSSPVPAPDAGPLSTPAAALPTPDAGDVSSPPAGTPGTAQDPVSPFLTQQAIAGNRLETAGTTLGPYMHPSPGQQTGAVVPAVVAGHGSIEHLSPARFDPVAHHMSGDLLGSEFQTPQRRGWLGFLFAPRPKKRVRNALL